jgi:hypothetical protein
MIAEIAIYDFAMIRTPPFQYRKIDPIEPPREASHLNRLEKLATMARRSSSHQPISTGSLKT